MVIGVGLDLLDIDRLERALERRPSLADRLFTAQEQAYASSRARPGQHLAARFCAKEAVTKALGLTVMRALEIEVAGGGGAGVRVALRGETARVAAERNATIHLSLTHTPTTAGASVIVEGVEGSPGGSPSIGGSSPGGSPPPGVPPHDSLGGSPSIGGSSPGGSPPPGVPPHDSPGGSPSVGGSSPGGSPPPGVPPHDSPGGSPSIRGSLPGGLSPPDGTPR